MKRSSATETSFLELMGNKWRVTVNIPPRLRKSMGRTKLKQSLETDSLSVANELKWAVIARLKQEIRDFVRNGKSVAKGERSRVLLEAADIAQALAPMPAERRHEEARDHIESRVTQILGPPVAHHRVAAWETEEDNRADAGTAIPLYDPDRERLAEEFMNVALHGGLPIANLDEGYKKDRLNVTPRTSDDHDRALAMLAAFCIERGIGDDIRKVDEYVAIDFITMLESEKRLASRTIKKYVSRLRLYFDYAKSRRQVKINPWKDARVFTPTSKAHELERPFTETEAARLLTGRCKQALKDVMMIAALTGARLEAVVDLRADDIIGMKCFRFKPQKREPGARFVPIHSDLIEIVTRRLAGKSGTDDLFPEYPVPDNPRRERSFAASKQFTTYRRGLGVDDTVPGKRRSRINFHSWRRYFITKGERAGNPEHLLAAIVGHTRKGMTLGHYSEGPEMTAARKAVESIRLPPLDGSPIFEPEAVTPRSPRP